MHRLLSIQNIIFMTLIFFSSFVLAIESNKPIDAVLADTAEQAEIAPAINFENTIPLLVFQKKRPVDLTSHNKVYWSTWLEIQQAPVRH